MTDPGSLDIEQPGVLTAWLRSTGHIAQDEDPVVTVLAGGVSNRTVLVERASGEAWVVKQALEKLRVQVDWFSSPERIHREADGLRWLGRFAPDGAITPLIFEDHELHLLGMTAVPQPHENWKVMLLRGDLIADHVEQFARLIGQVHRESNRHLDELMPVFGDRDFYETLRVEPYYRYTASQVPESAAFYEQLIADTYARQDTIVHGDFSPKNVLVHQGRLILLDHEVIHLGDPCFDLGFGMTHLLGKAHHLPQHRQAFGEAASAFWAQYWKTVSGSGAWTVGLEERAVRHTLGCLLARVRGRSPLEYMLEPVRARQASVVTHLLQDPPATVADLRDQFLVGIATEEAHA